MNRQTWMVEDAEVGYDGLQFTCNCPDSLNITWATCFHISEVINKRLDSEWFQDHLFGSGKNVFTVRVPLFETLSGRMIHHPTHLQLVDIPGSGEAYVIRFDIAYMVSEYELPGTIKAVGKAMMQHGVLLHGGGVKDIAANIGAWSGTLMMMHNKSKTPIECDAFGHINRHLSNLDNALCMLTSKCIECTIASLSIDDDIPSF